jgi:hypothetical protein
LLQVGLLKEAFEPLFFYFCFMKLLFQLSFALLILSCKTQPTNQNTDASVADSSPKYTGIVHVNKDNCPNYIEITSGPEIESPKKVYAMNLAKKYLKEGKQLRFNFTYSKAKNPEGCNVEAVVVLTDISVKK